MKRKRPQDGNYLGHKKTTKMKAKGRVIFNYFIIPAKLTGIVYCTRRCIPRRGGGGRTQQWE